MANYFKLHHDAKSVLSANGATWIVALPSGKQGGFPELSQDCGTAGELGKAIDRLQADLERLRGEGKKLFAKKDQERKQRLAK